MAKVPEPGPKTQFYALASVAILLALLYFGQEVLVPLALAVLFSFLMTPLVTRLERLGLGRVLSALLVVGLALAVIGALGWTVERRVVQIVEKLPEYRDSIRSKFQGITRSGGMVEKVREELKQTIAHDATTLPSDTQPATAPAGAAPPPAVTASPPAAPVRAASAEQPVIEKPTPDDPWPVRVYPKQATTLEVAGVYLGRFLGPVATAGLVLVFVVFMLIGREDLRDRLIRLVGGGRLHVTTQALDDAAARISRFLLAQLLINTVFGVTVALSLWVIDLTLGGGRSGFLTAVVAGMLCGVLRFVPYVGTWIGAALPLGLAFAAYPGNGVFFATLGMFLVVEVVISQVVEPNLLGSSTGLSPIAVLVSAVFWTWLWGPVGLLLSMPLTVILVVMGKYVPQLAFLDVLLGDTPVLDPPTRLYQRLIAGDDEEAAELAQEYLEEKPLEAVYDDLLIPALAQAEMDRHRGKLDEPRLVAVREGVRDVAQCLDEERRGADSAAATEQTVLVARGLADEADEAPAAGGAARRRHLPKGVEVNVLCLPARGEADEVAAGILAHLLERRGYRATVASATTLASEMLERVETFGADVVVLSAMPPKAALHARYLIKRLTARHPDLRLVVGLWAQAKGAGRTRIVTQGSVRVATTLAEAEDQIDQFQAYVTVADAPAGPAAPAVNGEPVPS